MPFEGRFLHRRAAALARSAALVEDALDRRGLDGLVRRLVEAGQVPARKQVTEGEASFPVQTYVRRTPSELVDEAAAEVGVDAASDSFLEQDVVAILTSKAVDYR